MVKAAARRLEGRSRVGVNPTYWHILVNGWVAAEGTALAAAEVWGPGGVAFLPNGKGAWGASGGRALPWGFGFI